MRRWGIIKCPDEDPDDDDDFDDDDELDELEELLDFLRVLFVDLERLPLRLLLEDELLLDSWRT